MKKLIALVICLSLIEGQNLPPEVQESSNIKDGMLVGPSLNDKSEEF